MICLSPLPHSPLSVCFCPQSFLFHIFILFDLLLLPTPLPFPFPDIFMEYKIFQLISFADFYSSDFFFFLAIPSNSFTYLSITTHSYIPFATELYSLGFSIQFHFWKCERGAMLLFVTLITLLMYHILWVSASILWLKLSWHSFWSNYWRPLISYNSHFTFFASNYCLSKRKETAEWNLYR